MADAKILKPFILHHEGGYAKLANDPGGHTNKGVTLDTFRSYYGRERTVDDLKAITDEQWMRIFRAGFWDKCRADEIRSQSVANMIVDWAFNAGVGNAVKWTQKALGLVADGIVGPKTLAALNTGDAQTTFHKLRSQREVYYRTRKGFVYFGKGWLNRLNAQGYGWFKYSDKNIVHFKA